MILVYVKEYADYIKFMRANFPYHISEGNKTFEYVAGDFSGEQSVNSIEKLTPYFLISGNPSDWFKNRFVQIKIIKHPIVDEFRESIKEKEINNG